MTSLSPPLAPKKEHLTTTHCDVIEDPWFWLKDPNYPEVKNIEILDYLKVENNWYLSHMAPLKTLSDKIQKEFRGRLKQDDEGVPFKDGSYHYQWKFKKMAEYRHWVRWVEGKQAKIIFDEAARALGLDYYNCHSFKISEDDRFLAWSEDKNGSERYKILVKDIETDTIIEETVSNTSGALVWAKNNKGYFYIELNENHRPYRLNFHEIGSSQENDKLIIEEPDDGFYIEIDLTKSRTYMVINISDHITSEVHVLNLQNNQLISKVICPRRISHKYDIDHASGYFFIRSNKLHKNFSLFKALEENPEENFWIPFLEGESNIYIRGFQSFKNFIIVSERIDGIENIHVLSHNGKDKHYIQFDEEAYQVNFGVTPEYDPIEFRLAYESMVTPPSIFDYNPNNRKLTLKKEHKIPSGYKASNYITKRIMAPGRDGTLVPISIVHHKDFKIDGKAPLHLYGYGAYGIGISPSFSTARLSLLDRGFAYAIAHIRGGDELGHDWYEAGKLERRTNSFHDFVDCANYLNNMQYSSLGNISCSGGSAGGSLMGYVANSNPEIWKALIAHVPFVDILNTMLDSTLPLTPMEWPEWGNPIEDKQVYDFIKSYSPYDNIEVKAYPPMMLTAGLNDPRVQYWEPAKWVAKLRVTKTDDNPLIFKTNLGAGHQGRSGRYEGLKEVAEEYAFLLDCFGIKE